MIGKISRPKTLACRYIGSLLVAMAVNVLVGTAPAPAQGPGPWVVGGFGYAVYKGKCYKTHWGYPQQALQELSQGITVHWVQVPYKECLKADYLVLDYANKWVLSSTRVPKTVKKREEKNRAEGIGGVGINIPFNNLPSFGPSRSQTPGGGGMGSKR